MSSVTYRRDGLVGQVPLLHPLVLASMVLLLVVIAYASVMEDGYITFRVVDNFLNGDGFRWNLHERVQVYTNPLWMIVHIPLYALHGNIFFDTLIIALVCTEIALFLALSTFHKNNLATICLFLLPLTLSRTFAVYSTSGFENVLGHALFAWFGWALIKQPRRYWLYLSLATSLSMVNRLDTVVFYVPVWGYLIWSRYAQVPWKQLFLGAAPIVGWELFSLFYYGFLFPNTKYAKLNTGVDSAHYLSMGISYLLNLVAVDFVSALLLLSVFVSIPVLLMRYCKDRDDRTGIFLSIAAGAFLYTFYVYLIGGTYLSGRLLSLQIFASAWLLLGLLSNSLRPRNLYVLAVALCMIKLFYPPLETLQKACPTCFRGVDSINAEVKDGLLDYLSGKTTVPEPGSVTVPDDVHLEWSMGKWGWSVDRKVKVVDGFAIVDPLLARLPMATSNITTMGITTREIPMGYIHFLKTGDFSQMDPLLAQYYKKLHLIIAGDLLSFERIVEIIKFNLGAYDYLRDQYVQKMRRNKALSRTAQ